MVKEGEGKKAAGSMAVSGALGAVIGLVATLALLYIFAALMAGDKIPEKYGGVIVICSAFLGAAIGAVIAARRHGSSVIPEGLIAGAAYMILILLFTAFGGQENMFGGMTLKLIICSMAGGFVGGALCVKRGGGKKPRRARR